MDPVANMLVSIKNAYMAKKPNVSVPYSKFKLEIAKALEKGKFVGKVEKTDTKIEIELIYQNRKGVLNEVKRISKLGVRTYIKSKNIKKVKGGKGMIIVTTPQGVMSGEEARQKKLGGEVICLVW